MAAKIKFLTDEDVRQAIVDGVRKHLPKLDVVTAREAGLSSYRDQLVLEFAAKENRILISQDVTTMKEHASSRLRTGKPMPGLFLVPDTVPIGNAIDEIVLIAECTAPDDWNNRIEFLPL
ncbi:MAG: DUF5615 family PIN-like protein [Acidobacteria bacterium]|nr:DUF5615 family PIN-like protein [Acidobacteriota bacterium]